MRWWPVNQTSRIAEREGGLKIHLVQSTLEECRYKVGSGLLGQFIWLVMYCYWLVLKFLGHRFLWCQFCFYTFYISTSSNFLWDQLHSSQCQLMLYDCITWLLLKYIISVECERYIILRKMLLKFWIKALTSAFPSISERVLNVMTSQNQPSITGSKRPLATSCAFTNSVFG